MHGTSNWTHKSCYNCICISFEHSLVKCVGALLYFPKCWKQSSTRTYLRCNNCIPPVAAVVLFVTHRTELYVIIIIIVIISTISSSSFSTKLFRSKSKLFWHRICSKKPASHSSSTRVPCSYFMISFVIIVSQYVTYQHVDSFYNIRVEMRISQKKLEALLYLRPI